MATKIPKRTPPKPIFYGLKELPEQEVPEWLEDFEEDFEMCKDFLNAYNGSYATFQTYRRDVERVAQWSWLIKEKRISELKRSDIEEFVHFCKSPPKAWIGTTRAIKFVSSGGLITPNPRWRPFLVRVTKAQAKEGVQAEKKNFELAPKSVKELLSVLSAFFNFLVLEERIPSNPVALIRQKSRFVRKKQGPPKIRRLSSTQWSYLHKATEKMAQEQPETHERSLFMLSCLYSMYLRISELVASDDWTPTMNDFACSDGKTWWLTVVGKGNKLRTIAVSEDMLKALKRWRRYLGLPSLPSPADTSPMVPKLLGKGPVTNASTIRAIIQDCFDAACAALREDGKDDEADSLAAATVHWLRHTGISDEVKIRPREHVRDDAGHSSGAITDKYIDVELKERHRSAKRKPMT